MNQPFAAESTPRRSPRVIIWAIAALILIAGIVVLGVTRGTNPAEGKGSMGEPAGAEQNQKR